MPEAHDLSLDQREALNAFSDWYGKERTQFFKMFGYAGSGKTTLANHIADQVEGMGHTVAFCAYTGKAAQVLRRKTGRRTSTIHGLIYDFVGTSKKGAPVFERANSIKMDGRPDLLIVDECSMINQETMDDLLHFGVPVLALGDPAQLPPINGVSFFQDKPDAMLETIHRQASESPIISLASQIRNGGPASGVQGITYTDGKRLTAEIILDADQVLCGKNQTRRYINQQVRKVTGREGIIPLPGERVVCLKNNRDAGFYNGETFTVTKADVGRDCIFLGIRSEFGDDFTAFVDPRCFQSQDVPAGSEWDVFDFGYALTVNKAQGSEWRNVVLLDDHLMAGNADFRRKWLYTAVTRASHNLTIAA